MTTHASGSFDVKIVAQTSSNEADAAALSRMTIDKRFHGDLDATSKGEMLSTATAVKGSAAYVAIERVTGTLHGRSGSFAMQHNATMTRGAPQLSIIVVPDSGTAALAGLTGTMAINIVDGKHFYELAYALVPGG